MSECRLGKHSHMVLSVYSVACVYSRGVGVCTGCNGPRSTGLQHIWGTHHHIKLTCDRKEKEKNKREKEDELHERKER